MHERVVLMIKADADAWSRALGRSRSEADPVEQEVSDGSFAAWPSSKSARPSPHRTPGTRPSYWQRVSVRESSVRSPASTRRIQIHTTAAKNTGTKPCPAALKNNIAANTLPKRAPCLHGPGGISRPIRCTESQTSRTCSPRDTPSQA